MQRSEPTSEYPGSVEKIQVMRERANCGFPIFHKHDKSDFNGVRGALLPNVRARNNAISENLPVPVLHSRKNLNECE